MFLPLQRIGRSLIRERDGLFVIAGRVQFSEYRAVVRCQGVWQADSHFSARLKGSEGPNTGEIVRIMLAGVVIVAVIGDDGVLLAATHH